MYLSKPKTFTKNLQVSPFALRAGCIGCHTHISPCVHNVRCVDVQRSVL